MLDDAFQRLPGEIETIEIRIAPLQFGNDPQCLRIVIEAAMVAQAGIERAFPRMPEGRMTEIMRQRQRLAKIFIELQRTRQRSRDLRNFQRVGEPSPVMVAFME